MNRKIYQNNKKSFKSWRKTWWGILIIVGLFPITATVWVIKQPISKNAKAISVMALWIGFVAIGSSSHIKLLENRLPATTPQSDTTQPSQPKSLTANNPSPELPEYKKLASYSLEDCSQWVNVVVKNSYTQNQLIALAKSLYTDSAHISYYLFDDNNTEMLQNHIEFEQLSSSEECLYGTELCEQSPDLYEWSKEHMIGVIRWTYNEGVENYTGRYTLTIFNNNQLVKQVELDGNTPQPMNYRALGTHKSSGKNWHDILLCEDFIYSSGDSLMQLAQDLHRHNPNTYYQLFDNDDLYIEYVAYEGQSYDSQMPDKVEEWADLYEIGIINQTRIERTASISWYLWLFQDIDGLDYLNKLSEY